MKPTKKHFVTFLSPGTFVHETTTKPIDSWDPKAAAILVGTIIERYGAKPFGFYFSTCIIAEPVDDGEGGKLNVEPKQIAESGIYYINGKVETLAEVEARNDPEEEILRSNMRCGNMPRVVTVVNGYKSVHRFTEKDFLVDTDGNIQRDVQEMTNG